jgi:hypothetical protein
MHEQDARVMKTRECRHELLGGECREQEQDGGDGETDHGSGIGGQYHKYRAKIREVHRGSDESFGIQRAFFDGVDGSKKDVGAEDSSATGCENALSLLDGGVG